MLTLIDQNFTASIQVRYRDNIAITCIYYRNIYGDDTLTFEHTGSFSLHNALISSVSQARKKYCYGASRQIDIVTCIGEQWWQYANTLYSYMPSIGAAVSDFSLIIMEFYIHRFTLEMDRFLANLTCDEAETLAATLSRDIPFDHRYYSELRKAQIFEQYLRSLE